MQPFNLQFNVACNHIARKLWPLGYDIGEAPTSLAELTAGLDAGRRLTVFKGGTPLTVFADSKALYSFRAWHDWCHYRGQHDFTMTGECAVARMQCLHVIELYGNGKAARAFCRLISEEIIGQAAYFVAHGRYVDNQREFARKMLPEYRHIGDE